MSDSIQNETNESRWDVGGMYTSASLPDTTAKEKEKEPQVEDTNDDQSGFRFRRFLLFLGVALVIALSCATRF